MLTDTQRRQLLGLATMALALFTALSLIPLEALGDRALSLFPDGSIMGVLGAGLARVGFGVFGAGVLLLPIVLALCAARLFGWPREAHTGRWAAFLAGLVFLV